MHSTKAVPFSSCEVMIAPAFDQRRDLSEVAALLRLPDVAGSPY
jgi:hypothetical protein